jgi:hypothetical protein
MHNLTSQSQLTEWRHLEQTIEEMEMEALNDYYECLIECDIQTNKSCKRICKELLM